MVLLEGLEMCRSFLIGNQRLEFSQNRNRLRVFPDENLYAELIVIFVRTVDEPLKTSCWFFTAKFNPYDFEVHELSFILIHSVHNSVSVVVT